MTDLLLLLLSLISQHASRLAAMIEKWLGWTRG